MWHRGLSAKMEQAGVCGSALAGFWSYLLGRRQVVTVDGVLSDFEYLQAGVPQGAIISPLLFSLYMNDISASSESQINLFTDDTSLYVVHKSALSLSKQLQEAIDGVAAWFRKWLLSVNSAKSAVMVFPSSRMQPVFANVHIEDAVLPFPPSSWACPK